MLDEPSRSEIREELFYSEAEKGKYEYRTSLFISEEKKLIQQGFSVERLGTNKKKSLPSIVSCKFSFKTGIPPVVSSYIDGIIQTFPPVGNWGQKLYVIAARANKEKAQNNNE